MPTFGKSFGKKISVILVFFCVLHTGEKVLPKIELSASVLSLSTVVHDFNGHGVNGMHGVNGKNCYDGPFYVVNNGKIRVWL